MLSKELLVDLTRLPGIVDYKYICNSGANMTAKEA